MNFHNLSICLSDHAHGNSDILSYINSWKCCTHTCITRQTKNKNNKKKSSTNNNNNNDNNDNNNKWIDKNPKTKELKEKSDLRINVR